VATLNGTSKDDILFIPAGSSGNELLGLEGNDSLDATTGIGNNILRGGDGNDELFAFTNDQLFGDGGSDSLYSDGNGKNTLFGGDGNDSIFADRNDSVFGDAGDDLIFGGVGGNKLTGGSGKDLFYLTPDGVPQSPNEILDFTQGEDKVLITAIPGIKTFADLTRVQVGADTVLRANVGGTVQDLGILKNIQADTLNPADFNRAPVTNPNKTLALLEDAGATPLGITTPTDTDGDTLTVTVSTIPDATKGEIRLSNGAAVALGSTLSTAQLTDLVFVPVANANGGAGIFSYTVSDGKGGSAKQDITLSITPVNDAPVVNANKTLTLLEDASPLALSITAPTDIEGDSLSISVNSVPDSAKGVVTLSDGTVVNAGSSLTIAQLSTLLFVTQPNGNGSAGNFSYTVNDGQGGTASQSIAFNITPVNDAPEVEPNKTLTVLEDSAPSPLGIKAPTDVDGDRLTIAVTSLPDATKGQIRLSDGTVVTAGSALTLDQLTNLVFAPIANRSLEAGSFSYTVNDGNGGIATQTVSLFITPDNDGGAIGDPHLITFDGFHYDFQATGDFLLLRGLDSNLEVQTRQMPWVYNPATTINTGLATLVDGNRVEFYVDQPLPLIDNRPLSLEVGQSQALGQGSISRTAISGYGMPGDLYTLTHANGDELKISVYRDFLIDVTIDLAGTKNVMGLLGNNNGSSEDDLTLRDDTSLTNPLAPENLYGAFSRSWQVSENESLFSTIASSGLDPSGTSSDLQAFAQRYVLGGNGDDILIGVDATQIDPGKGEVDLFMGNKGADTFVLGDQNSPYYAGLGQQDYALITDFWAEDSIQLNGKASDYVLGSAPAGLAHGTGIFLAQDPNELLGIIQGTTFVSLDLSNPSMFQYV
jgi:hypothetical protein